METRNPLVYKSQAKYSLIFILKKCDFWVYTRYGAENKSQIHNNINMGIITRVWGTIVILNWIEVCWWLRLYSIRLPLCYGCSEWIHARYHTVICDCLMPSCSIVVVLLYLFFFVASILVIYILVVFVIVILLAHAHYGDCYFFLWHGKV